MTTPISCATIQKSVADVNSSLKETIVNQLIEDTNQNINTAVTRGLCQYTIKVPSIMFGYPAYNPLEIAKEIKKQYELAGFCAFSHNNQVTLTW